MRLIVLRDRAIGRLGALNQVPNLKRFFVAGNEGDFDNIALTCGHCNKGVTNRDLQGV